MSKLNAIRLLIVCYHLPLKVTINAEETNSSGQYKPFTITWAESLIAKSTDSVSNTMKTKWIGTVSVGKEMTEREKSWLMAELDTMDCIPIFLSKEVARSAYKGFCKTVMWPVFHNVDQLDHIHAAWNLHATATQASERDPITGTLNHAKSDGKSDLNIENSDKVVEWNKMETEYYQAFKTMNQQFAQVLFPIINSGNDVVWVHDYHLMLLPSFLRGPPSDCGGASNKPVEVCQYCFFFFIFFLFSPI